MPGALYRVRWAFQGYNSQICYYSSQLSSLRGLAHSFAYAASLPRCLVYRKNYPRRNNHPTGSNLDRFAWKLDSTRGIWLPRVRFSRNALVRINHFTPMQKHYRHDKNRRVNIEALRRIFSGCFSLPSSLSLVAQKKRKEKWSDRIRTDISTAEEFFLLLRDRVSLAKAIYKSSRVSHPSTFPPFFVFLLIK